MLEALEIADVKVKPYQAAQRKFSMQFMAVNVNAVLNNETVELLEYRHLIKKPKYKKIGGNLLEMKFEG